MYRAIVIVMLALWLAPLGAAAASDADYPLAEGAGVIQELDRGAGTLVINGMRYEIAMDAQVEIGGSFGAFTMLEAGMRVYFEYLRVSSAERRIVLLREVPAEVELQGV